MNVDKCLNLDGNPRDITNGSWKHARNMLLDRGFSSALNEGGFEQIENIDFGEEEIKGWINVPNFIIIFTYDFEDNSKVYKFNVITEELTLVKSIDRTLTPSIQFSNFISGVYTYNHKNELIVVWCDGIDESSNEILILNIDDPCTDNRLLLFNPNLLDVTLTAIVRDGGALKAGTYYFAFAFELPDNTVTAYSVVGNKTMIFENQRAIAGTGYPIALAQGETANKNIEVTITKSDLLYTKGRLGVIHFDGITTTCYVKENISLFDVTTRIAITDLDKLTPENIQVISSGINPYVKANIITTDKKRMLLGGVAYENNVLTWEQGQLIADSVVMTYERTVRPGYPFALDSYLTPTFQDEEVYAFYIGIKGTKGNILGIWNIPGATTEASTNPDKLEIHTNVLESYPSNYPTYGEESVKHFKIPDLAMDVTVDEETIINVIANVTIPNDLKPFISEWFILQAKRTLYNNRLIGNDILFPDTWHTPNGGAISFLRGHSFDLMLTKASLSSINKIRFISYLDYAIGGLAGDAHTINFWYRGRIGATEPTPLDVTINIASGDMSYIPNDNLAANNTKGESCISIKTAALVGTGVPAVDEAIRFRVRYLNEVGIYYSDFTNQQLITLGSANVDETTLLLYGDCYVGYWYPRLTDQFDSSDPDTEENVIFLLSGRWHQGLIPANLRVEGSNTFEKIFPFTDWNSLHNIDEYPASKDNYLDAPTGKGYNMAYYTHNYTYQGVSNSNLDEVTSNPVLIAKSNIQRSEANRLGWRRFESNDYYLMSYLYGMIINLLFDGINLYIQQLDELHVAFVKDVLTLGDSSQAYLGTGELFDRDPQKLILSDEGQIGCQNKLHGTLTPYGYLVVDKNRNKVFLVNGTKPIEISQIKSETYFQNKLPSTDIRVGYDSDNKRVIIHFVNDNESLSFSVVKNEWVSFHDYNIQYAITNKDINFYFVTNILVKYNKQRKGRYGDYILSPVNANVKNSFIDVYFTKDILQTKLLQSLAWKTISDKLNINNYQDTIDFVMFYNDNQCSGIMQVNQNLMFFDSETGLLKNNIWYFNKIEDNVINDRLPFLSASLMPTSNVNTNRKDWFNKSEFICDWAITRLGINNQSERNLIINFVDFLTQIDNR